VLHTVFQTVSAPVTTDQLQLLNHTTYLPTFPSFSLQQVPPRLPILTTTKTSSRLNMLLRRGLSSVAAERADLLLKIYAPFSKLDKNSPEYKRLARSGRVWEDYHRPSDSEYQGYNRLQQVLSPKPRSD